MSSSRSSRRPASGRRLAALALAGGAAALSIATAGPAAAAPAGLSDLDQTFLMSNEQTNLTELTIDPLAQQKSTNQQSLALAQKSMTDHTTAKQLVTQLAQQLGVSLPAAPTASQQAQAAKLRAAPSGSFDLLFAQVQVAGHQQSIALTQKELASGTNAQVKQYAQTYLPLARMHLQMAQEELAALGGSSTAVSAGSGGTASTDPAGGPGWGIGLGAGLVAVAAGAGALARGRAHR
jgi:putative membrane protein